MIGVPNQNSSLARLHLDERVHLLSTAHDRDRNPRADRVILDQEPHAAAVERADGLVIDSRHEITGSEPGLGRAALRRDLRDPRRDDAPVEATEADDDGEALPEFLAGDDEEAEADAPQMIAAE